MAVFKSTVPTTGQDFQRREHDMLALVDRLRAIEARAIARSRSRDRVFRTRGQLSPHDRVARLLDPGMPFLRLHSLANYLVEDENPKTSIPGANIICGIGFVSGTRCMIWVDDSGISAGAMTTMTSPMAVSLQDIAKRQKLPLVHLVESAGANLLDFTVENWVIAGEMFRNLAETSAMGIPSIAVLHGPSTAGGAYMPGMSDYVIGVRHNGLAALAGAALVKAATGEEVDERALGGTEMHAGVSGLVDCLADDDAHGIMLARQTVARLNWAPRDRDARPAFDAPLYSPETLPGIVGTNYRTPYDMREVAARLVDGSRFMDFKPDYGPGTVCLQTEIMGHACGIIGNNGPIDPQGATKAAQFYQLCDQAQKPMIFLHNTTGFIVGTRSEQAGMIKHGAKMVQGAANIRVPKISLYIGASFGAGNYAMCGFAYKPDFLFAWPNAMTNVMGGEQAARTMREVTKAAAARRGTPLTVEELDANEQRITDYFSKQESAFYSAGRLLNHGMIDPRDTRKVLGFALATCLDARARELQPNSFGVGRF